MPTVTINIAGRGTPTSDGSSKVGHMWYELKDGNGNSASYGFSPVADNNPFNDPVGPGGVNVHGPDSSYYQGREYSRTIEITQAQYDSMKNFGENPAASGFSLYYNGLTNSCVDFTWKALEIGGLNSSGFQGRIWPTDNIQEIRKYVDLSPIDLIRIDGFLREILPLTWDPVISPILGTNPDPLVKIRRFVDPLILDLDGDGLEITPLAAGVLFDANGDTIKTGTAWAGADDGILVRDLNGNGLIDSGREMFGDETILTTGPNAGQKASDGYAALKDLDSNADNKFDGNDIQYANLRVWRDLNQDGVSQANELQTLVQAHVQNINLASAVSNTQAGDAVMVRSSSYTRTDGSQGQTGSFILAQNNFASAFPAITISTGALALPGIKGSGWVRDLREAATQSPELIALTNAAQNTTSLAFKGAVANLIRAWGNDSVYNSAGKQAATAGYGLILSEAADAQEQGWMDASAKTSEGGRNAFRATA